MRILLTNDDGISAPGLEVLAEMAHALSADVWIVAPETDQSGKGHSLTLTEPLRLRQLGERRFAVRGTPTDCVIMGLSHVMPERPDLILSGVNRGTNMADDVTYSGTVAAAMEGTILGIKSIALSQAVKHEAFAKPNWSAARGHGLDIIKRILAFGIAPGVLMNVNFPACNADEVVGVEVTAQGARTAGQLGIEERLDARENPYFWIKFQPKWLEPTPGTDMWAVQNKAISVTPLRLDLTDDEMRLRLKEVFG
ncbi:MAG: 5'/3'-nucleotidase SurE [Ancalomicrobiaceae bacterium]|nr:5'/3'-nucleotidase SurE [Ancalomicrobiaceae bacterium]